MSNVNSISIGSMQNSQVQQDAQNSSQNFDQSSPQVDLEAFVRDFADDISKIGDQHTEKALHADIDTMRLQSRSPRPKKGIIRECLGSIKTILEGTTGNVLASYLPTVIALLKSY